MWGGSRNVQLVDVWMASAANQEGESTSCVAQKCAFKGGPTRGYTLKDVHSKRERVGNTTLHLGGALSTTAFAMDKDVDSLFLCFACFFACPTV